MDWCLIPVNKSGVAAKFLQETWVEAMTIVRDMETKARINDVQAR